MHSPLRGPNPLLIMVVLGGFYWTDSSSAQCTVQKLVASDREKGDEFGLSVAIDGDRAIVGSAWDDVDFEPLFGSAYIFDVTTGQELFKLTASDGEAEDVFGTSVALRGDRAIVGAQDDDNGEHSGSVYVFDVTSAQELFKLTASDGEAWDGFGDAVALSGNRAVVGAFFDADNGLNSGSAYVFDVTTGQELLKLTASDGAIGDSFGGTVAISGNRAIIGADGDDDLGQSSGSAYVFDVSTGKELFKLTASDGEAWDAFGSSVALVGDCAIVGAPNDDDFGNSSGSAYLFDLTTGQEIFKLLASNGNAYDGFGASVAINGGDRAVVGAPGKGNLTGSIYVFDAATGQELIELSHPHGKQNDGFGLDVAIGGNQPIVGVYGDDDKRGSAFVFGVTHVLGANYCGPANLNSTGQSAVISATGCEAVSANELAIEASSLPPLQFGLFLASETKGFVPNPGGSQGNLCLAGNIGRFVQQVQNSGPGGSFSISVDLTDIPTNPPQSVMAGQTWNFQAWFRDMNPGPTSNFTDGVSVLFE